MKKLAVSAVIALFLSTAAFANIVVFQDGKITTYKPGSEVAINAKTTARVLYDGILITVPKGQKVQISKENGKIKLFGINMKGVEIAGKHVSSKGQATVSISPETGEVASIKGSTTITSNEVILTNKEEVQEGNKPVSNQIKTQTVIKTETQTKQAVTPTPTQSIEPVVFPTVSEYVNEVATQQSTQDVERPSSSQYAPSGD